jgi:hypothetical protein
MLLLQLHAQKELVHATAPHQPLCLVAADSMAI